MKNLVKIIERMMKLKKRLKNNKLLTTIYRNMSDEDFEKTLAKALKEDKGQAVYLQCMRIYLRENPTKTIDDFQSKYSDSKELEKYAYKKIIQPMLKNMGMEESEFQEVMKMIRKDDK